MKLKASSVKCMPLDLHAKQQKLKFKSVTHALQESYHMPNNENLNHQNNEPCLLTQFSLIHYYRIDIFLVPVHTKKKIPLNRLYHTQQIIKPLHGFPFTLPIYRTSSNIL